MRLRRETGDWTIRVKALTLGEDSLSLTFENAYLPKGLSADDFVGAIVESPAYNTRTIPPTLLDGVIRTTITNAMDINGQAYSTTFTLATVANTSVYYDRRTGKISTDPKDFDPVEPDEGGEEDVTGFVITKEGIEYTVTPSTVTFTKADAEKYTGPWQKFIGRTVTDVGGGTYTITEEMIGTLEPGSKDKLYFVNPTDKTGSYLYLTGDQSSFPITLNVSYMSGGVVG